jgi:hypothetical protein
MDEKTALRLTGAEKRLGCFRNQDGSQGDPIGLYQLPGSDAWLSWESLRIIALRLAVAETRAARGETGVKGL